VLEVDGVTVIAHDVAALTAYYTDILGGGGRWRAGTSTWIGYTLAMNASTWPP
jgi:hypothetical protein